MKRCSPVPPCQRGLTPAASCPPTVTFINSLPAGEFLHDVSRCSIGSAEVSDEVRHEQPVGWSTSPSCLFQALFSSNTAVIHFVYLFNLKHLGARWSGLLLSSVTLIAQNGRFLVLRPKTRLFIF